MQNTRKLLAALAVLLAPCAARADVDAFGNPLPDVNRALFAVSVPVPVAVAFRAGSSGGATVVPSGALEGRLYFGHHGLFVNTGFADSPRIAFFDAGYSFADFSSRRMRGFNGAVSVDVGPSIAYVGNTYVATNAQNATTASPVLDVPSHATIGGRLSSHVDLFVGPVMVGLVLGFRAGVPVIASSKDSFEGVFFFQFEIGAGIVRGGRP